LIMKTAIKLKTVYKVRLADSKKVIQICDTLEEARSLVKQGNELAQAYKFDIVHAIKAK